MLRRILGLFIIFSPFTSYFAISPWLRFPVILLLAVYIVFTIKLFFVTKIPKKLLFTVDSTDFLLLLLLGNIMCSAIFNGKGLNHLLAYSFTFMMYFILLKKVISFEQLNYLFILRMFAISTFICGLIIIADWTLINFFSIGFRKYFAPVDNKISNMLYFEKGYFITVGGVAEEPGSMALLMNIISPLGLLYWKLKGSVWKFLALLGIYLLSLIFLFSTAGIVAALTSLLTILSINFLRKKQSFRIEKRALVLISFISILAIASSGIVIMKNINIVKSQVDEIKSKILFSTQNESADLRASTWKSAFVNWENHPLWGNGPGEGVKLYGSGYHSVYLTLLADTGLLSLFLFLFFLLLCFRKLMTISFKYRKYLFFAFFSSLIHFAIIGDFYHAPFWILLILIHKIHNAQSVNE